ncbi:MAG: hypothetical protein J07HB67_02797 [halophilic archaeon J07HB67]|nr:MAG: hypothetical protein J07HB67_02797 [halophilic archaeon J07HB67]
MSADSVTRSSASVLASCSASRRDRTNATACPPSPTAAATNAAVAAVSSSVSVGSSTATDCVVSSSNDTAPSAYTPVRRSIGRHSDSTNPASSHAAIAPGLSTVADNATTCGSAVRRRSVASVTSRVGPRPADPRRWTSSTTTHASASIHAARLRIAESTFSEVATITSSSANSAAAES